MIEILEFYRILRACAPHIYEILGKGEKSTHRNGVRTIHVTTAIPSTMWNRTFSS